MSAPLKINSLQPFSSHVTRLHYEVFNFRWADNMLLHYFLRSNIIVLLLTLIACNSQTEDAVKTDQTLGSVVVNKQSGKVATISNPISLDGTDSTRGKRFFVQCQVCHTVEAGAANLIGPNLSGLLGRTAGKQEGFNYSVGLAEADFSWNVDSLNQFLIKPNDFIPGTSMIFNGIADEKMRLDLLAYLIEATSEK